MRRDQQFSWHRITPTGWTVLACVALLVVTWSVVSWVRSSPEAAPTLHEDTLSPLQEQRAPTPPPPPPPQPSSPSHVPRPPLPTDPPNIPKNAAVETEGKIDTRPPSPPTEVQKTMASPSTRSLIPPEALEIEGKKLRVIWDFGACDCTGWNIEAVYLTTALAKRMPVRIIAGPKCICKGFPQRTLDELSVLMIKSPDELDASGDMNKFVDVFVSQKPPDRYPRFPYRGNINYWDRPAYVIGRSMYEANVLPSHWKNFADRVDEVWIPSKFLFNSFYQGGFNKKVLRRIPLPIDSDLYDPFTTKPFKTVFDYRPNAVPNSSWRGWYADARVEYLENERNRPVLPKPEEPDGQEDANHEVEEPQGMERFSKYFCQKPESAKDGQCHFVFLSVFKWEERKNPEGLLRAYFSEFMVSDPVCLVLRTYMYMDSDARNRDRIVHRIIRFAVEQLNRIADELPCFDVITEELGMTEMPRMYRSADAFVLPSHGEGWGMPVMEAMAMGLPVLATNWSGTVDFLNEDNGIPIPVERMVEARGDGFAVVTRGGDLQQTVQWAEPDLGALRKLMRRVVTDNDFRRSKTHAARQSVIHKFSLSRVADTMVEEMLRIRNKLAEDFEFEKLQQQAKKQVPDEDNNDEDHLSS